MMRTLALGLSLSAQLLQPVRMPQWGPRAVGKHAVAPPPAKKAKKKARKAAQASRRANRK